MKIRLGLVLCLISSLVLAGCPKRAPEAPPPDSPTQMPAGPAARARLATLAFSRLVWPGGARLRGQAYQVGQRSHWQSSGQWAWPERYALSYLGREESGDAWWRVRMGQGAAPELVVEAQIMPGAARIRRLRELGPQGKALSLPMPAGGASMGPWAINGLGGMPLEDRGNESITGPAGSFLARHWRFNGQEGARAQVWLVDGIPGGVVRARWRTPGGEQGGLDWVRHDIDQEGRWPEAQGIMLTPLLP